MKRPLLLGTHNKGKAREIAALLGDLNLDIKTLDDFAHLTVPEETGATLEENARLKARHYGLTSGLWTLADDTGLQVDALGGAPGVHCSTYAGQGCSYADNNDKLIRALSGLPREKRGASFCTVMACFEPQTQRMQTAQGKLVGRIAEKIISGAGFGYDPVFVVEPLGKTLSQLSLIEKNAVSHRAQALEKIKKILAEWPS